MTTLIEPAAGATHDTVLRILRAAEKLFAEQGYHATTMRAVASAAGVGLSLVVYHFKNKESLYYAIFHNRQYVNETRARRLAEIPDLQAPDAVEQIVDAFIGPVLELHENPEDIWFARLVLREAADPSSQDRNIMSDLFDPMAREFISALRTALPDRANGFHYWAYLFCVGALTMSAFDTRVGNLTEHPDLAAKNKILRDFILGGLGTR